MRGKHWLLLTRRLHLDRNQRQRLTNLFEVNRRLAKACLFRDRLTQFWTYTYEANARRVLSTWLLTLRWQRLPALEKLAKPLLTHLDGIQAYCHVKVPFGVVEAINGNIRTMLRRGLGYRDHAYLLLKVHRATGGGRRLRTA